MAGGASTLTRARLLRRDYGFVIFMTVTAGLVGLIVALAVSLLQEPQFRASTSVSLRATEADLGMAEAADRLAGNTAAWVESETFADLLTEAEAGGLDSIAIADRTRARALPKEMRLVIEFEDENAGRAASVANGLARVAVASARSDLHGGNLEIAQIAPARIPEKPISPRLEMALPAGLILGLFVGLTLGFTYHWLQGPAGMRRG